MKRWRIVRLLVVTVLLSLAVLAAVGVHLYRQLTDPEALRDRVVVELRRAWPHAIVDVAHVDADPWRGVTIQGLSVREAIDPESPDGDRPFLDIESISAHPDMGALLEGRVEIAAVTLVGPHLYLYRDAQGTWNLSRYFGDKPPTFPNDIALTIREGAASVADASGAVPGVEVRDVRAEVQLSAPGLVAWDATATATSFPGLTSKGSANVHERTATVELLTHRPADVRELEAFVPATSRLARWYPRSVSGELDAELAARLCWQEDLDTQVALKTTLRQASFTHAALPYPVHSISARLQANRTGLTVDRLGFRFGPAVGSGRLSVPDWQPELARIDAEVEGLGLTDEIRALLPPDKQQFWDKFLPTGRIDLAGSARLIDGKLKPVGTATLHEGTASFYLFPYRVTSIGGTATLDQQGRVTLEFDGQAGGSHVTLAGSATDTTATSGLDLVVRGNDAELDETFIQALPASAQPILRKFVGPVRGDFVCSIQRDIGERKPTFDVVVDARARHLVVDWFRYPLRDVSGQVRVDPRETRFTDFTGKGVGNSRLRVNGKTLRTDDGTHVEVTVAGQQVPLDANLRAALDPCSDDIWQQLRPEGHVDLVAHIVRTPAARDDEPVDLHLTIDPLGASITPVAFPYRLDDLRGRAVYANHRVSWQRVTARHGSATLRCAGLCDATGADHLLEFRDLVVEDLAADEDLVHAVPQALKDTIAFLAPTKPLDVDLPALAFQYRPDGLGPVRFSFEGSVAVDESRLIPSVGFDRVRGMATLQGWGTDVDPHLRGNIDLESVHTETGFSATDLSARLRLDGEDLSLTSLRGTMYGGALHGSVRANLYSRFGYEALLDCFGARLGPWVRENWPDAAPCDGTVDTHLYLEGHGETIERLGGGGWIKLRNADIVRTPFLLDVFDAVSLQVPDGQVFNEGLVSFELDDVVARLTELQLTSPALSLFLTRNVDQPGSFDVETGDVDVRLGVRWAKDRVQLPLIGPPLKLAADQLFCVRVRGRMPAPLVYPEPVPSLVPGLRRLLEAPTRLIPPAAVPPTTVPPAGPSNIGLFRERSARKL